MLSLRVSCKLVHRRHLSTVSELYQGLISGNRGCLAKCITLVESTRTDKQQQAHELLTQVVQGLKQRQDQQSKRAISFRIGSYIFNNRFVNDC
jgi:hypothetical protein